MNTSMSWRVIGTSVQGTSHQKKRVPCQDAHAYSKLPGGSLLIAVADGAGTAERAEEGAKQAVEQATSSLKALLKEELPQDEDEWHIVMRETFGAACESLTRLATKENISVQSFATTLTCVFVSDTHLVVGQIGDGIAVALSDSLFTAIYPQQGEFVNETNFLTMPDALNHIDIQVHSQTVQALAVMTDGLLRLAMKLPGYDAYSPFFQPLLSFVATVEDEEQACEELGAFLASERVCARTNDDKTLVLAARTSIYSLHQ